MMGNMILYTEKKIGVFLNFKGSADSCRSIFGSVRKMVSVYLFGTFLSSADFMRFRNLFPKPLEVP